MAASRTRAIALAAECFPWFDCDGSLFAGGYEYGSAGVGQVAVGASGWRDGGSAEPELETHVTWTTPYLFPQTVTFLPAVYFCSHGLEFRLLGLADIRDRARIVAYLTSSQWGDVQGLRAALRHRWRGQARVGANRVARSGLGGFFLKKMFTGPSPWPACSLAMPIFA